MPQHVYELVDGPVLVSIKGFSTKAKLVVVADPAAPGRVTVDYTTHPVTSTREPGTNAVGLAWNKFSTGTGKYDTVMPMAAPADGSVVTVTAPPGAVVDLSGNPCLLDSSSAQGITLMNTRNVEQFEWTNEPDAGVSTNRGASVDDDPVAEPEQADKANFASFRDGTRYFPGTTYPETFEVHVYPGVGYVVRTVEDLPYLQVEPNGPGVVSGPLLGSSAIGVAPIPAVADWQSGTAQFSGVVGATFGDDANQTNYFGGVKSTQQGSGIHVARPDDIPVEITAPPQSILVIHGDAEVDHAQFGGTAIHAESLAAHTAPQATAAKAPPAGPQPQDGYEIGVSGQVVLSDVGNVRVVGQPGATRVTVTSGALPTDYRVIHVGGSNMPQFHLIGSGTPAARPTRDTFSQGDMLIDQSGITSDNPLEISETDGDEFVVLNVPEGSNVIGRGATRIVTEGLTGSVDVERCQKPDLTTTGPVTLTTIGSDTANVSGCNGLNLNVHGTGDVNARRITGNVGVTLKTAGTATVQGKMRVILLVLNAPGEVNLRGTAEHVEEPVYTSAVGRHAIINTRGLVIEPPGIKPSGPGAL